MCVVFCLHICLHLSVPDTQGSQKMVKLMYMRGGPVVKNTGSSSRGLGLKFQGPRGGSQPSLNSGSGYMNCTTF